MFSGWDNCVYPCDVSITHASYPSFFIFSINASSFLDMVSFLCGADFLECIVSYCWHSCIVSRKHSLGCRRYPGHGYHLHSLNLQRFSKAQKPFLMTYIILVCAFLSRTSQLVTCWQLKSFLSLLCWEYPDTSMCLGQWIPASCCGFSQHSHLIWLSY